MVKNRVKEYRKAAKLTLVQLSGRAGLPVSTINDIEHGAEPRVVTAIYLAKALRTSVELLWPI